MTLFFVPFFIISRVSEPKNMWQVLAVIGSQCVSGAFFFVFVFLIKAVLKHDILSCGWMDRIDLFQTFKRVKYNWSVWTFAKQNFWYVHMHLALNMDAFFVSFYIWYLLYNCLVCVCLQYVKAAAYCEQMKFYHFFFFKASGSVQSADRVRGFVNLHTCTLTHISLSSSEKRFSFKVHLSKFDIRYKKCSVMETHAMKLLAQFFCWC